MSTAVDGGDVAPGDGVCEVTTGVGDCSLRAAVDEANASAADLVTLEVPAGTYGLTMPGVDDTNAGGDLDVVRTGSLVVETVGGGVRVDAGGVDGGVDVVSGGVVAAGVGVTGAGGVGVSVGAGASLVLADGAVFGNGGAGVDVAGGGFARLMNSTVSTNSGTGVSSLGELHLSQVTVTENGGGGVTGDAELHASVVGAQAAGPDCGVGVVTSLGYNLDSDGSCGLAGTGDVGSVVPLLAALDASTVPGHVPLATSPAIDAVPVAECGIDHDQTGTARPLGAGCDRGAMEADLAVHLVVDDGTDAVDAGPGDGACTTAGGGCTLRAAVDETNANPPAFDDTITITTDVTYSLDAGSPYETTNATGDIDILGDLSIDGDGHTIDAAGIDAVVHQVAGDLVLADMTITGGLLPAVSGAGGIRVEGETVVLDQVNVTGNAGLVAGGLQIVGASVTVTDSVISGNTATYVPVINSGGTGGGMWLYSGDLTMTGSTIAGNHADRTGGAMLIGATAGALLTNSTISGNTVLTGEGAAVDVSGTAALTAVTVAGNISGPAIRGGTRVTASGTVLDHGAGRVCEAPLDETGSAGFNVVSDSTCALSGPGNVENAVQLVDALEDNGGSTPTNGLFMGAPALDAIPAATPGLCDGTVGVDQRGMARPADGACDAGAVEGDNGSVATTVHAVVDDDGDDRDVDPGDGSCATGGAVCTLRAAIDETNANPWTLADTITLTTDAVLTRAGPGEEANDTGDLDTSGDVTLVGGDHVVDADGLDRVLDQRAGSLTVIATSLTGGEPSNDLHELGGSGGAVRQLFGQALTIDESTIAGNVARYGGAVQSVGDVEIVDSTISANESLIEGGGLHVDGGPATITDSTISENVSGSRGGAVFADGIVDLVNTTVTENEGGIAALYVDDGDVSLTASTVSGNPATHAFRVVGAGSVTLAGSIVDHPSGDACRSVVTSSGYNIASDTSCGVLGVGDIEDVGPLLSPLADNGGPTDTLLPYADSPAVDAIPAATAGLCDGTIPTDQRGMARPSGGACDIGAIEGDAGGPAPVVHSVVDDGGDAPDAVPGDGVCATAGAACTLRAAIDESNANPWSAEDTITLTVDATLSVPGSDEDANGSGDLDVYGDLTLLGAGHTIDGSSLDRVLHAHWGDLTLDDVTITGGDTTAAVGVDEGGGVFVEEAVGEIEIDGARLTGNDSGGLGGGLYVRRDVTITDATVSDNTATRGAGISLSTIGNEFTMTGSTVSGNHASGVGGGLYVLAAALDVTNSTISGNTATGGAALYESIGSGSSVLTNVTVADNTGSSALRFDDPVTLQAAAVDHPWGGAACSGPVVSGGFNVVSDGSCALGGAGDLEGVDPLLGALADNGGPTSTHILYGSSPALDVIPAATAGLCDGTVPADQRGGARPVGGACDAGAVEGDNGVLDPAVHLVVGDGGDAVDAAPGDGVCATAGAVCTLRAAVDEANANPAGAVDTITLGTDVVLSIPGAGDDANASGDVDVSGHVVIDGAGHTVEGSGLDRVFDHHQGSLTLEELTVTGGLADRGGGVRTEGDLTVSRSWLASNTASNASGSALGGAIYQAGGVVTVSESTLSGNKALSTAAAPHGGGVYVADGTLEVTNSTLVSNAASGTFFSRGGAVALNKGAVTFTFVTLADNGAIYGRGLWRSSAAGGAFTVAGSAFANPAGTCFGTFVSGGYNVTEDTTCGFAGTGDVSGAPLLLDPLADNGGPTPTRLPGLGSPVIAAIPAATPALCDGTVAVDQRGTARPQGGGCDAGAAET